MAIIESRSVSDFRWITSLKAGDFSAETAWAALIQQEPDHAQLWGREWRISVEWGGGVGWISGGVGEWGGGFVEVWGNGGISGGMGEWGVSAGLVEVCVGSLCHHREVTGRDAVSAVGVAFYLVSIRASSFKLKTKKRELEKLLVT